ncbi:MAG: amidase domain-containing protein [Clostridium sp.]|nr:amidase domain-containing protein [Clostridium sp.]
MEKGRKKRMRHNIAWVMFCVMLLSNITWWSMTLRVDADSVVSIEDIEDYLMSEVKLQYEPDYDIIDYDIHSWYGDSANEVFTEVSLNIISKVQSVEDLEVYSGMLAAVGISEDCMIAAYTQEIMSDQLARRASTAVCADGIACFLEQSYQEMSAYVGVELSHTICFKTVVRGDREQGFTVYREVGNEYVEDTFEVMTKEEQYANGYALMQAEYQRIAEVYAQSASAEEAMESLMSASNNRLLAVQYAMRHTSETDQYTACSICGSTSCGGKSVTEDIYNQDIYNKEYKWHHQNDCANYVSQCMHEGKFPITGTWYPESTPWVNVGGLVGTMTQAHFWSECSSSEAITGDVVASNSHIMFIVGINGSDVYVCAHTHDRKNHAFKISDLSGYRFYHVNYLNY